MSSVDSKPFNLYESNYIIQSAVVVGVLTIVITLYFTKAINFDGIFEFLKAIPTSMIIVGFGATSIAACIIAIFFINYGDNSYVYWLGFPVLIYIVSLIVIIINQSLSAQSIDMGLAASASINPAMAGVAGLVLGGSAYARAPVVSAFPVINSVRVVDDVLSLEQINPIMKGVGIAYWVWWLSFIFMLGAIGKATVNKS